jgi:hypothetical protein
MSEITVPTLEGKNFTAIEVGAFADLDQYNSCGRARR